MSAPDTSIVDERLGRLKALLFAMQCVGERGGDLPGDAGEVCGWLGAIAQSELAKVLAVLDLDVTNKEC